MLGTLVTKDKNKSIYAKAFNATCCDAPCNDNLAVSTAIALQKNGRDTIFFEKFVLEYFPDRIFKSVTRIKKKMHTIKESINTIASVQFELPWNTIIL
jgi:hypothetical protein